MSDSLDSIDRLETYEVIPITRPKRVAWDDAAPADPLSTYPDAVHGPDPVPDWVITSGDAVDVEVGILKTGKEGDVHLVERWFGEQVNLLAAKRYRAPSERIFQRDDTYTEGRVIRDKRLRRAVAAKTDLGRKAETAHWIETELEVLGRLWCEGVAVPYPVQMLGRELMMEFIGSDDGVGAPRLANVRVSAAEARDLFSQAVELMVGITRTGLVHGDLSPYNLLVHDGRLVAIDVPQAIDLAVNPHGVAFLQRDVENVCAWFQRKGVTCDPADVFARVFSAAR